MNGSEINGIQYSVFCIEETQMYGILCSDDEGRVQGKIDDITDDLSLAENFCHMLNSAQVHPYHFYDVYEDFFG